MNPLVIAASAVIVAIIAGFVVQRLNRSAKVRIAERQRALHSWKAGGVVGGGAIGGIGATGGGCPDAYGAGCSGLGLGGCGGGC
jgi:hypothetical protein